MCTPHTKYSGENNNNGNIASNNIDDIDNVSIVLKDYNTIPNMFNNIYVALWMLRVYVSLHVHTNIAFGPFLYSDQVA